MLESDVEALWQAGHHAALWHWVPTTMRTLDDMRAYVRAALTEQAAGRALPAVVRNAAGRVIGSTRFGALRPQHRCAELGWTWLTLSAQRTGANREIKYLMLTYAFEELGLQRVEFKTDVRHHASRRALLGIGARQEGVFRRHMLMPDGQWRDTVYFSILAEEWPRAKVRLQSKLARGSSTPRTSPMAAIVPGSEAHRPFVRSLFREVIAEGKTYAFDATAPDALIDSYWFGAERHTFVALSQDTHEPLGVYVLRANQPGGGAHVANASYLVHPKARGQGLAHALCQHSIATARRLGFQAVQFNFVVATNHVAISVWQDCGFAVIGTIPQGFRLPDGTFSDALIMFREL